MHHETLPNRIRTPITNNQMGATLNQTEQTILARLRAFIAKDEIQSLDRYIIKLTLSKKLLNNTYIRSKQLTKIVYRYETACPEIHIRQGAEILHFPTCE